MGNYGIRCVTGQIASASAVNACLFQLIIITDYYA